MKLRAYVNIKPDPSLGDPPNLAERLYWFLGPAVPDRSGWSLMRPGLLTTKLVNEVCRLWKAPRNKRRIIRDMPQIRGDWIFFDYLFSKTVTTNPIIKCLSNMGLIKYGETRIANTYTITAGLNYKTGWLIFLYRGRKIETELDDLAYVIAHILKAENPKLVEINTKLLTEMAIRLRESPRWQLRGWLSKEGRNIEIDLIESEVEEYLTKLKKGDWRSLLFQDPFTKLRLTIGPRLKTIELQPKKRIFNPGPKRNLRPIFEELAKIIKPNKLRSIVLSSLDAARIQKAYTERRGIMATIKFEQENKREPIDLSYEFFGYDVKSSNYLIEVKAFRDSTTKNIQLTKNEYETLIKEEKYLIYVVEDAWDDIPKLNVIKNVKNLIFKPINKSKVETKITLESYFECNEDMWRYNIFTSKHIQL